MLCTLKMGHASKPFALRTSHTQEDAQKFETNIDATRVGVALKNQGVISGYKLHKCRAPNFVLEVRLILSSGEYEQFGTNWFYLAPALDGSY